MIKCHQSNQKLQKYMSWKGYWQLSDGLCIEQELVYKVITTILWIN